MLIVSTHVARMQKSDWPYFEHYFDVFAWNVCETARTSISWAAGIVAKTKAYNLGLAITLPVLSVAETCFAENISLLFKVRTKLCLTLTIPSKLSVISIFLTIKVFIDIFNEQNRSGSSESMDWWIPKGWYHLRK